MRYFFIFFAWSDLESAANKLLGTAKNGRLVVGDLKQSAQLLTVEEERNMMSLKLLVLTSRPHFWRPCPYKFSTHCFTSLFIYLFHFISM